MTAAIHPATHFIAPDAAGDLNLWRGTREDPAPVAVLRECDTDPAVWAMVVSAMSTPDRLTDEERAIRARAEAAASLCGPCDGGLPMNCTCDPEPRAVIADLLTVVDALAARLVAQPPEPAPCANCSGPDDPHPPAWECSGCGAHVDVMPTTTSAQPPATDRDALTESYASFWWAENSGETETWEELHDDEREAVVENSDAEAVVDWVVDEVLAARPAPDTLADRVQALAEEWERSYSAMLIGGFSGCSIGADTAAKRLRALLAGRSDASPEGGEQRG